MYCLEHFEGWKHSGAIDLIRIEAKVADALIVLDQAWKEELKNGEE
jgi:hypothetical protein